MFMVTEAVIKKNNDDGTAFELLKNDAVMTNR
jgi:hypothetical protein